jgi:hypothetical protein
VYNYVSGLFIIWLLGQCTSIISVFIWNVSVVNRTIPVAGKAFISKEAEWQIAYMQR